MPRQKVSLELHKNKILWILYNAVAEVENKTYKTDDLNAEFNIPNSIIDLSIEELKNEGLCETQEEENWYEHPFTMQMTVDKIKFISITRIGIESVNEWTDEFHDNVVRNVFSDSPDSNYIKYFSTTSAVNEPLAKEIPAADRYVTITHNQEYEETLRTLDDAIRQFKEDKYFNNVLGQEKGALVAALEGGRQLLNDTKIWVATAYNLLVESLRRIDILYKKAAVQGAVRAVVDSALEKILKLLGLE